MKKLALELFAGSRSFGKAAEKKGYKVFSMDKFITEDMHFVGGVEDLTKEMIVEHLGGEPTVIWGSPVCSAWSKTGWFHYWDTKIYKLTKKFIAKKSFAYESVEMVRKTIEIFSWFPKAFFYMENPQGMLAFHPVIQYFKVYNLPVVKRLVTYCQYGHTVRKPTEIWTNNFEWKQRKPCSNGDTCHLKSPRCTQSGIMTLKNSFERSKIPDELCDEIISSSLGEPRTRIDKQYTLIQ